VARATSERDAAKASGKAEESETRAGSSVERSLEEFIARANAVVPPPAVGSDSSPAGKRRRKESELGPDDRTEIVSRPLPYAPAESRRFVWTMFAVAFAAGAAAVVLALRLLAPRPAPLVAPAPVIPPIVVIPQPTVEVLPEPMTDFPITVKPTEAAKPEPASSAKKKKKPSDKDGKTPTGLVDPFAE
jgi:hypothetical protein